MHSAATQKDTATQIRELEAIRHDAMERADADVLATLLAEDLSYTHSDASTDGRQPYLARVADGTFDYGSIAVEVIEVRDLGDVALAFTELQVTAVVRGTPKQIHNRALSVWVRHRDDWRLSVYQPTAVPTR